MKALYTLFAALLFTSSAHAGGYSGWAVPTVVEYSNEGLLVYGNFNDVNNCDPAVVRPVFVAPDPNNPDFLPLVSSMLMMAVQGQTEVQFFLQSCTDVSWRAGPNPVFNLAWTSGVLFKSGTVPVGVAPENIISRLEDLEADVAADVPTEVQVETNVSVSLGTWVAVTHETQMSLTRRCGANGGTYSYFDIRESATATPATVGQVRCWEYNTDNATFTVPAGWQYRIWNYVPEIVTRYTHVPITQ